MVLRFFLLASVFLFVSCSVPERDNPLDPDGVNYRSSSKIIYGTPVNYGGETYETVVIGEQTWFKRNLNYAATGSKCGSDDDENVLSDANSTVCDTYGRLYNWITAMALPANCSSNSCASQIGTKHQGICPKGWYIPSDEDWNTLIRFIDPSCLDNKDCGVGTKLKFAYWWNTLDVVPKGTDDYGFSALPGGIGGTRDNLLYHISNVGNMGYWWSANEYEGFGSNYANGWSMSGSNSTMSGGSQDKFNLLSVRCLKDNSIADISSSSMPSSSSVVLSSSSVKVVVSSSSVESKVIYGATVSYENETYETVVIGEQTWFKRNLNYNVSGSKCYNNQTSNCNTYGRLYDWATAMSCNSNSCSGQIDEKHQGICPTGWHIPSDADWNALMNTVNPNCSDNKDCAGAGTKLKYESLWNNDARRVPNGTDDYGFSALPGGRGNPDGSFGNLGYQGAWWVANVYATCRDMSHYNEDVYRLTSDKDYLFSIRCVKD